MSLTGIDLRPTSYKLGAHTIGLFWLLVGSMCVCVCGGGGEGKTNPEDIKKIKNIWQDFASDVCLVDKKFIYDIESGFSQIGTMSKLIFFGPTSAIVYRLQIIMYKKNGSF